MIPALRPRFSGAVFSMLFFVQGCADDCELTAATDTARKALAEAIDWHVVKKLKRVTISDGAKRYSISEFAWAMALKEISRS
jgi:hypothetical protein